MAGGQRVGFLQARESRDSVAGVLGPQLDALPMATYESEALTDLQPAGGGGGLVDEPEVGSGFLGAYAKTHGAGTARTLRLYAIGVTTATAVGAAGYTVSGVAEGGDGAGAGRVSFRDVVRAGARGVPPRPPGSAVVRRGGTPRAPHPHPPVFA